MKKRIYKSISVKSLCLDTLAEKVRGRRIVVGVDVAKKNYYAALADEDGKPLSIVHFRHPDQSEWFVDGVLGQLPSASLVLVMEPSGTYGDGLRHLLQLRGIAVYRISPKRVQDAAEVFDGVNSLHDRKACVLIAQLHLAGVSELWSAGCSRQRTLKAQLAQLRLFDEQLTGHLNRLEALLARHWPGVTEWLGLDGATLLALLQRFATPQEVAQHSEEAARLMGRVGGHFLSQSKIDAVLRSAGTLTAVPALRAERELLSVVVQEARRARRAVAQAKRLLVRSCAEDATAANLRPLLGAITAAVVLAELGDPRAYPSAAAYEKSAGLNLKERSSGNKTGKDHQLRITKRGPGLVRKYLYLAILRLIQQDPYFRAWYLRKVQRSGGRKKLALVALLRKLVRALWYVGQGQPWDPSRLFDASRLNIA